MSEGGHQAFPGPNWPNIPDHARVGPAEHAAHTTPKGVQRMEELLPPSNKVNTRKTTKLFLKFMHKPHLKTSRPKAVKGRKRKKNE